MKLNSITTMKYHNNIRDKTAQQNQKVVQHHDINKTTAQRTQHDLIHKGSSQNMIHEE